MVKLKPDDVVQIEWVYFNVRSFHEDGSITLATKNYSHVQTLTPEQVNRLVKDNNIWRLS